MNIAELNKKITDQAFMLEKAKANGVMVNQEVERTKNILFNNMNGIIEALKYAQDAEKKINLLTVEIDSADAELQEKDDEINALKKAVAKAQQSKAKEKKTDVEQGVQ